jgi:threonine/homoserine/homoserine lactone efflux protein
LWKSSPFLEGLMIAEPSLPAAFILGVAYAALPGVVNTECVRRGMAYGFGSAVRIQTGALIGDAAWAAIALTGAALLLQHQSVNLILGLVGAGFLFHLARTAFSSALRGTQADAASAHAGSSLGTGVVFSLANPAGLAFWTGVGGGMLGAAGGVISLEEAAGILLPFLAGALLWGIGLSALVAWGRRYATPRIFRLIDTLCGLALGYFGLRLLWTTLRGYARWFALARPLLG